mgnify:CR=1 FL=1
MVLHNRHLHGTCRYCHGLLYLYGHPGLQPAGFGYPHLLLRRIHCIFYRRPLSEKRKGTYTGMADLFICAHPPSFRAALFPVHPRQTAHRSFSKSLTVFAVSIHLSLDSGLPINFCALKKPTFRSAFSAYA